MKVNMTYFFSKIFFFHGSVVSQVVRSSASPLCFIMSKKLINLQIFLQDWLGFFSAKDVGGKF